MNYDFAAIEKKWQANWEKTKPYAAVTGDKRPKFYGLIEFPYPSGQGLHVGHPRPFTAMEPLVSRQRHTGTRAVGLLTRSCNLSKSFILWSLLYI